MSPKTRRITREEARGMRYYINTKEAVHERAHVHVSHGRGQRTSDLKVWLDNLSIAAVKGDFPLKNVPRVMKLIEALREDFISDYEEMHGKKKR